VHASAVSDPRSGSDKHPGVTRVSKIGLQAVHSRSRPSRPFRTSSGPPQARDLFGPPAVAREREVRRGRGHGRPQRGSFRHVLTSRLSLMRSAWLTWEIDRLRCPRRKQAKPDSAARQDFRAKRAQNLTPAAVFRGTLAGAGRAGQKVALRAPALDCVLCCAEGGPSDRLACPANVVAYTMRLTPRSLTARVMVLLGTRADARPRSRGVLAAAQAGACAREGSRACDVGPSLAPRLHPPRGTCGVTALKQEEWIKTREQGLGHFGSGDEP